MQSCCHSSIGCLLLKRWKEFRERLEIRVYQLSYSEEETLNEKAPIPVKQVNWASHGKGSRVLTKMRRALSRMSEKGRRIFLTLASQLNKERGSQKL